MHLKRTAFVLLYLFHNFILKFFILFFVFVSFMKLKKSTKLHLRWFCYINRSFTEIVHSHDTRKICQYIVNILAQYALSVDLRSTFCALSSVLTCTWFFSKLPQIRITFIFVYFVLFVCLSLSLTKFSNE